MTLPDRRMMHLLSRAQRRMQARADLGLSDLGVTGAQAGALFCIGEQGVLVGELAEALGLAQSAASGLAARLVEAGFAVRAPDPADRRAVRLFLSDAGRVARQEAARRAHAENAAMMKGFTEGELATVVRWLRHVGEMEDHR